MLLFYFFEQINILDMDKELKTIFDKLSLNISETFDKEVRKRASRRLEPALATDKQKKIDEEIEAGIKDIDAFNDGFDDEDDE